MVALPAQHSMLTLCEFLKECLPDFFSAERCKEIESKFVFYSCFVLFSFLLFGLFLFFFFFFIDE